MVNPTEMISIDENENSNSYNRICLSKEDISSVMEESVKINPNLEVSTWAIINTDNINNGFKIIEIHAPRIQSIRDLLQNDNMRKIIIVWEKSEEELCNENKYDFAYELRRLRTYPNFRYISHKKLLDKEYMKNLYTKQEKKDIQDENDDMYWYKRLNKVVMPYLSVLSEFPEFSFDYKYKWWGSDLDKSLEHIVKEVSWYCPWFLRAYNQVDDILRFLKNYVTNLLNPRDLRYIRDTLEKAIENSKKDEFRDPPVSDTLKNLTKVIAKDYMWYDEPVIIFEEFPTSLESYYKEKPAIKDQVEKTDELKCAYEEIDKKLKENGCPKLFYSLEDLLNSYEVIKEKCMCYDAWDEYYEKQKKEWKDVEYKKVPFYPVLSWVYCDIDGTLVKTKMDWKNKNDYEVNEKVVKKLLEFYNQWKKITLRSSWTLLKKQDRLWNDKVVNQFEEYWLTKKMMEDMWIARVINGKVFFNIKNKYAYRYRIPEIVIDDRDSNRFMYHMNIYPKKFINIKDL